MALFGADRWNSLGTYVGTPASTIGAVVQQPIGYGELAEDDERASRGYEGVGELAWRFVRDLDPRTHTCLKGITHILVVQVH